MSDIYYSPEKYGLELVAEHQFGDVSYDFDIRAIWLEVKTGLLYTARDAGCSCPSPFDRYDSVKDLDRVSYEELEQEAIDFYRACGGKALAPWLDTIRNLKAHAAFSQIKVVLDIECGCS